MTDNKIPPAADAPLAWCPELARCLRPSETGKGMVLDLTLLDDPGRLQREHQRDTDEHRAEFNLGNGVGGGDA